MTNFRRDLLISLVVYSSTFDNHEFQEGPTNKTSDNDEFQEGPTNKLGGL